MHFLCDNTEEGICFFVDLEIKKLREVCNFTKFFVFFSKLVLF